MMIFGPELPATLALLVLAFIVFGTGGVVGVTLAAVLLRCMR